jgi:hypothetical protein
MKFMFEKSAVILFLIIFVLIASPVNSQTDNQPASVNTGDITLTNNVMKKISGFVFYGIFDWVNPTAKNGVVKLEGWVHLPWLKSEIQDAVEKLPGVKSVNNQIKTTFGPGRIGVKSAGLIYRDPMFWGEAFLPDPPVHIIVNNNIIILEGTVSSEAQKSQAEYLVNTFTNAFSVKNDLKVVADSKE